jgi:serine/threonine-protein kinase
MTRNIFIAAFVLIFILALLLFKKYLHLFAFWKKKSFIGHYRIVDKIGSGGMGIVYKASHVMADSKPVAIKVIREEYSKDPTQRKRFLNEALLVDQLDHPHIVKVFERGEHNEQLFIAMELLEGQSLTELIQDGGHIPLPVCLSIMNQLFDTMARVHAKGIVHRDLKPENILLVEQDGQKNFVKLLDFGLAKSASLTRLTETGEILGTINYLPPERISRQEFSPAGDIYSLGVVFYEMVTREKPFLGETPLDVIKQILEKEPIEPVRFRPDIPGELNVFILKMMSKKPGDRPGEKILLETIAALRNRVGD